MLLRLGGFNGTMSIDPEAGWNNQGHPQCHDDDELPGQQSGGDQSDEVDDQTPRRPFACSINGSCPEQVVGKCSSEEAEVSHHHDCGGVVKAEADSRRIAKCERKNIVPGQKIADPVAHGVTSVPQIGPVSLVRTSVSSNQGHRALDRCCRAEHPLCPPSISQRFIH